jgi:DHA1 family tetracycline resistance protein-like MFS transporter
VDRRLLVIALILFVNALGTGLILPLLPFFALEFGASPLVVGLLIATLPLFAALSGPPLGALSDRIGRKPVLLGSLAGSVVGFVVLAVANSLPMVFLSRVIDGVSAGNTSTARAAIADITSRQGRATGIGVTFAMESLGLILGPVLGGVFAAYGLTVSAFVAAAIALVCLLLTLIAFPETRAAHVAISAPRGDVLAALRQPTTRPLVLVVFAIQLLIMLMWGSLALYAHDLFGFGGQEMGYVSAFAASVGVLSQVAVLRILVRTLSERVIVAAALFAMAAGLLTLAATRTPVALFVGVALLAASFNVAMPTAMGLASRLSSEHDQGRLMGTLSSAISLASVIGPILAGALYAVSPRGSYLASVVIALAAALLALRR